MPARRWAWFGHVKSLAHHRVFTAAHPIYESIAHQSLRIEGATDHLPELGDERSYGRTKGDAFVSSRKSRSAWSNTTMLPDITEKSVCAGAPVRSRAAERASCNKMGKGRHAPACSNKLVRGCLRAGDMARDHSQSDNGISVLRRATLARMPMASEEMGPC